MIINHNLSSINAYKNITSTDIKLSKSIEKLSSGLRINRAGDDAAGLAISEQMRSQITGMDMAKRNCQDVASLLQTAEGALESISNMLNRMKELTVQAGNGVYNTDDLSNIQLEINEIIAQINIVATTTDFNKLTVLDGSYATNGLTFQIGTTPGESVTVKVPDMKGTGLGVNAANATVKNVSLVDVTDITLLAENLDVIETAIQNVTATRAVFGAVQNRTEYTMANLANGVENLQAAESRIRDVDMAKEMANYSQLNVLMQAGMSIMAQSNQKTQSVLKLLQ